jgi:hypothetical protein
MTPNRYIIIFISAFFYLFVFLIIFAGLALMLNLRNPVYMDTIVTVFAIYFSIALSTASYFVARVFFLADKKAVSQKFFIGFLSFVYLSIVYLLYDVYPNTHNEKTEQYAIVSFILVTALIVIPVILARPNRFFLKLIAKIFREF